MHLSWQALLKSCGTPRHTHMVAIVASQQAIDLLQTFFSLTTRHLSPCGWVSSTQRSTRARLHRPRTGRCGRI